VADSTESYVEAESRLELSYEPGPRVFGSVFEKGRGRPVLFIHGQPGSPRDFEKVVPLLADDHRLLMPDRPGYGTSGSEPLSIAQNADVLAELLEELGTGSATLVGHSYGGGIAILLAARRPDLVSGLVLVGSVGSKDSVDGFDHLLAAPVIGDAFSAACLFALASVFPLMGELAAFAPPSLRERLRVSLPDSSYLRWRVFGGTHALRTFVFEQRSLVREIDAISQALEQIEAPTVVIAGDWDVVVHPSAGAKMAASVHGAEFVTVARMGHFVMRDAPRVVADAVRTVEERVDDAFFEGDG
jgi:pimeloyl-ACP methyl ester carboxylesterase